MREFWFEAEGRPLFSVEDGEGPVLVMLHGALANHQASWLRALLSSSYSFCEPL